MKRLLLVGCAAAVATSFAEGEITFKGVTNAYGQAYSYSHVRQQGKRPESFGINTSNWSAKLSAPGNPNYWNSLVDGDFWSDGLAPTPDKTYLVSASWGRAVTSAKTGDTVTFNGKKIIFGQPTTYDYRLKGNEFLNDSKAGYLFPGGGTTVFANDGADLVYGGFIMRDSSGPFTFSGKFNVLSPEEFPWWIHSSWCNPMYVFDENSSFTGAAGTGLRLYSDGRNATSVLNAKFFGDMSGYYGSLTVPDQSTVHFANGVTMPGTVKLIHTAYTGAGALKLVTNGKDGTVTLGAIEADAGATITATIDKNESTGLARASSLTLANAGAVTGRPVFSYKPGYTWYAHEGNLSDCKFRNATKSVVKVLDVPEEDSLDDLFTLQGPTDAGYADWTFNEVVDAAVLVDEKVEEGRRRLYAELPKMVYLVKNGGDSQGLGDFDPGCGDHWYGCGADDPIDPDTVYVYPNSTQGYFPYSKEYVCPARGIVLGWVSRIQFHKNATINNLHLTGSSWLMFNPLDASMKLDGNRLVIHRQPSQGNTIDGVLCQPTKLWAVKNVEIASPISGDGALYVTLRSESWGNKNASPVFTFTGDNSQYHGKIRINNPDSAGGYVTELKVSSAANLGGSPRAMPGWSLLQLDPGGLLTATESFELATEGRGVYANGGQIGVAAGKRLTLRNQLTLGAKLVKKGAGTLALGGPLRFSSEQREEPLPDMDVLSVEAGALRGLNKGAVDGLKVELGENAAIEIASPTETISDDERTYGLYSVNENGYIVLMDGVLNVRLSEEGRYDADGADLWPVAFSQAICTVANGEAGGLEGNFKLVDCPRGVKLVSIETVPNEDGETTTFVAHFKRSGFAILVR